MGASLQSVTDPLRQVRRREFQVTVSAGSEYTLRNCVGCLSFEAKGETDVTVILKSTPGAKRLQPLQRRSMDVKPSTPPVTGVEPNYTIIFGSHRNSCLKIEKNGGTVAMVNNIGGAQVSSKAFLRLWVQYDKGTISVGVDEPSTDTVTFRWQDNDDEGPIPGIEHIGLSCWDHHVSFRAIKATPPVVPLPDVSSFSALVSNLASPRISASGHGRGSTAPRYTSAPVKHSKSDQPQPYNVESLFQTCTRELMKSASPGTVCMHMQVADMLLPNTGALYRFYLDYLASHFLDVAGGTFALPRFPGEGLCLLPPTVLADLLHHNAIAIPEKKIYDVIEDWATAMGRGQGQWDTAAAAAASGRDLEDEALGGDATTSGGEQTQGGGGDATDMRPDGCEQVGDKGGLPGSWGTFDLQHETCDIGPASCDLQTERTSNLQHESACDLQHERTSELQHESACDLQHERTSELQHESACDLQHERTSELQHESACDLQHERTSELQHESACDLQHERTSELQHESACDLQHERTSELQHESACDLQHESARDQHPSPPDSSLRKHELGLAHGSPTGSELAARQSELTAQQPRMDMASGQSDSPPQSGQTIASSQAEALQSGQTIASSQAEALQSGQDNIADSDVAFLLSLIRYPLMRPEELSVVARRPLVRRHAVAQALVAEALSMCSNTEEGGCTSGSDALAKAMSMFSVENKRLLRRSDLVALCLGKTFTLDLLNVNPVRTEEGGCTSGSDALAKAMSMFSVENKRLLRSPLHTQTFERFQRRCLPESQELSFVCDADKNGVCHFIGTLYGSQEWVNPVLAKRVEVKASSPVSRQTDPKALVQGMYVDGAPVTWWSIDLGARHSLIVNYYTIRQDGSTDFMRHWVLQASSDNQHWCDIQRHRKDTTIKRAAQYASWPVLGPAASVPYRYFRLLLEGPTTSPTNPNNMCLAYFELYGHLYLPKDEC
eukprot:gene11410-12116_t